MNNSTHFYYADGTPCYTLTTPMGRVRRTTLSDARSLRLLPGVSSIVRLWPSEGLRYYVRQMDILSAITTPRVEGETDDALIDRIIQSSEEEAMRAADTGTTRHALAEAYHRTGGIGEIPAGPWEGTDIAFCEPYFDWFRDNVDHVINSEFVVVSPMGYAGRVDLHCRLKDGREAVIDLKNRKTLATYHSDAMQLVAYCNAVPKDGIVWRHPISIVLSTKEPKLLVKEWDNHEFMDALHSFGICFTLWKKINQYDPGLVGP